MKKLTITLEDDEYAYIKSQFQGYVRRLVQDDMNGVVVTPTQKGLEASKPPKVKLSTTKPVIDAKKALDTVIQKNISGGQQIDPNDICPKCGFTTDYMGCKNPTCNWKKK